MFLAVNYISCSDAYRERFEQLFTTRAKAIDTMPGFQNMKVLKPKNAGDDYLIVSYWDTEDHFSQWTNSAEFLEGHKRGFADLSAAKKEGKEPPMRSVFKTYEVLTD